MVQYNDVLSYKIVENGYEIYRLGALWITQYDQYSKIYKPDGTYEENCLLQLEELTKMAEANQAAIDAGEDMTPVDTTAVEK